MFVCSLGVAVGLLTVLVRRNCVCLGLVVLALGVMMSRLAMVVSRRLMMRRRVVVVLVR